MSPYPQISANNADANLEHNLNAVAGESPATTAGEGAGATFLQTLGGHEVDQVADAAGVSPLVVVPGDYLDTVAADH